METTIKATLAKKNSEMEKLEQSKKSHLRMIMSSAMRLRLKYGKVEDPNKVTGETEARKIRMYETHFPGFCYLRNGEYRKKTTNNAVSSSPDPVECSEMVKAILFTDNELDVCKTMCLHLLGTHLENRKHIQRKDGRLCSYVKAQTTTGNQPNTLQTMSQRVGTYVTESLSKYDKMLPRYILDVTVLQPGVSTCSFKTSDFDSGSDDESKKKRKLLVPVYINNEIRMILNSVMEALEAVESNKLKSLIELASSPEELRNMLANEEIQEFITELAWNPLVMKPTSYDYIMAHMMFDKIPEKGTLETVAQVLEVYDDLELKSSLHQIRRGIWNRHMELTNVNVTHRRKNCMQERVSMTDTNSRASSPSVNSSVKYLMNQNSGVFKQDTMEDIKSSRSDNTKTHVVYSASEKENTNQTNKKLKSTVKGDPRNVSIFLDKMITDDNQNIRQQDDDSDDDEDYVQNKGSIDSTKCDLHSLTNSQRILLGLKVASLKSRPINMHQFEGKKKVDLAAIINPIIRPQVSDIDYKQNSPENHLRNFALISKSSKKFNNLGLLKLITSVFNLRNRLAMHSQAVFQLKDKLKPEQKIKKSVSKISTIPTTDLENLTRALLANLRLQISETENKIRVHQFMAKI